MTSLDPASSSADVAGLPADPTRYRRKGLGVGFWLWLISAVVILAGGVAVGLWVASWWAKDKPAGSGPAIAVPWRASSAEPVDTPVQAPLALTAPPADLQPAGGGQVASLAVRLEQLESSQQRTAQAASAALATAALIQSAQTSRPFTAELAAVQALLPDAPDVSALRRVAEQGAPTRTSLAMEFPAAAAHAIAASRQPDAKSSLLDRARHALGTIVTIRRIDYVKGNGAHAILARAEALVDDGDVEGALAELDHLPPAARDALGDWRTRAERRAEVDRRVSAIRDASLRSLRESVGGRA